MDDFLQTYGFLIATMLQAGLLGLSLYFPLQAGQLSLASPGFYAVGGYAAAILLTNPAFAGLRDTLGNGMFPLTWLAGAVLGGLLGSSWASRRCGCVASTWRWRPSRSWRSCAWWR